MYRCEVCETVSQPGQESNLIPSGFRVKDYDYRRKVHVAHVSWKKKPVLRDDPGGVGYEWEGELTACNDCYARYQEELADVQQAKIEKQAEAYEERLAAK